MRDCASLGSWSALRRAASVRAAAAVDAVIARHATR